MLKKVILHILYKYLIEIIYHQYYSYYIITAKFGIKIRNFLMEEITLGLA